MDFLSIIESDAKISMFMKEEKMEKSNKGCTFYSNDMKCITVSYTALLLQTYFSLSNM